MKLELLLDWKFMQVFKKENFINITELMLPELRFFITFEKKDVSTKNSKHFFNAVEGFLGDAISNIDHAPITIN